MLIQIVVFFFNSVLLMMCPGILLKFKLYSKLYSKKKNNLKKCFELSLKDVNLSSNDLHLFEKELDEFRILIENEYF